MNPRKVTDGVFFVGAPDWDRRLFDALIPLPEGTSYNAYLITGQEKTALIDTVDPTKWEVLKAYLEKVNNIDYVVIQHVEQDHSGSLPMVLEKYPNAVVIANSKAKELILTHLHVPEEKIQVIEDGDKLDLGGLTLQFIFAPWVHWPETMLTYLPERKLLFTCDFLGSHLATSSLFIEDERLVYLGAKRYYAEIMSPFRNLIKGHLEKIKKLDIDMIAPSHGPIYQNPDFIIEAYEEWISDQPKNIVLLPWISMHGSTQAMVEYLTSKLVEKGVEVQPYDISKADLGELTMATVDAATIILAAPTILTNMHPMAELVAYWVSILRPKAKAYGFIGSYGWGGKTLETVKSLFSGIKADFFEPVLVKGLPTQTDYEALDKLADAIVEKHRVLGLLP
ncbi:MAG: FprA family A-type flavoprotein [Coprothermobacter sp.]|uniref:Nitric oxide reductase (Type A flavoprotein FprA) (FMNprotein fprA) (Flavoprotein A) n=1 Tax=Coprothermobacter proteolyticus (strain ATCC 35245 / DSM 5265 / OCM 4 / BT) TaxID=309798 RepID=B5Y6Y8_COPPD|nr:FprA family A-type flavoprotein [Coprothermobacter proteolyticus]ACI17406.1 metallo-beta-lactamase [Coprothermobacter proteolyticus DSM 5265]MBP8984021.1 FprA family A-type flavoprotein [Coprothermobacter sp.]